MTKQTGIVLAVAGVVVFLVGIMYHFIHGVQLIPHFSVVLIVVGLVLAAAGVVGLAMTRSSQV